MRGRTVITLALVAAAASLAGCSSSTRILTSWKEPEFRPGSVKKVVVMGLTNNQSVRRLYESMFVDELKGLKIEAVQGREVIEDLKGLEKDVALRRLQEAGVTHVLATRLVDQKTVAEYHPPTTMTMGWGGYPGWYGGWYPYMSMGYTAVTSPGYYDQKQVYNIETNLYDVAADKLVWTGMSQTVAYDAPSEEIKPFIDALVYELRQSKIL